MFSGNFLFMDHQCKDQIDGAAKLIEHYLVTGKGEYPGQESEFYFEYAPHEYHDDRLFVLELARVTTRSLTRAEAPVERWAVITRRNVPGFPPFRSDDFGSREEALQYLYKIAPLTPRVSLGGCSPVPPPSLPEFKAWLAASGLDPLPE